MVTQFISNVNLYLDTLNIKQTYLSTISKIEKSKLSRLLNGKQKENSTDMEMIAGALGKPVSFFLSETMNIPQIDQLNPKRIAFYAGNPTTKQVDIADLLVKMIENVDFVLNAKGRSMNNI